MRRTHAPRQLAPLERSEWHRAERELSGALLERDGLGTERARESRFVMDGELQGEGGAHDPEQARAREKPHLVEGPGVAAGAERAQQLGVPQVHAVLAY